MVSSVLSPRCAVENTPLMAHKSYVRINEFYWVIGDKWEIEIKGEETYSYLKLG